MPVTDVVILKKLDMLEIDVMRLIQLMDADFQSNNKLVGKKALANAEMCDEVQTSSMDQGRKENQFVLPE